MFFIFIYTLFHSDNHSRFKTYRKTYKSIIIKIISFPSRFCSLTLGCRGFGRIGCQGGLFQRPLEEKQHDHSTPGHGASQDGLHVASGRTIMFTFVNQVLTIQAVV